jgi:uncharacterized protein with HEPN domain
LPPTLADRLAHILTAIEDVQADLSGCSLAEFSADRRRRLAVERSFAIMSEASRYIPSEIKAKEQDIAWRKLADLGNLLRHAYHRIDPDILWNIAGNELLSLKQLIERIISEQR